MIISKKISYSIVLSLLLPLIAKGQGAIAHDTIRLTQRQAVKLAIQENNNLKAGRLEIKRQQAGQRKQLGQLLPQANLSGNYSYTIKKQRMFFGGEDNPMARYFPEEGIEVGMTHNIQAGLHLNMPLIVPQLWSSLGLSRQAVKLAIEEARSSELKLKHEVQKSYVSVLLTEELKSVLHKSLNNLETNYTQTKEKFDRGLIAEYDLIRLSTQVQNLKPELIQAEQNSLLAKMKLKLLLNIPFETEIELIENLADFQKKIYEDLLQEGELITGTKEILASNPLLSKLDLQAESLKKTLSLKKMSFMPSLSLNFMYNYNYTNNSFQLDKAKRWSPYSMVSLNLNIPLFSGGSRYYDLKSTKLQLEQMYLQRLQAERELHLALRQAHSSLRAAKEQFIAAQTAETSATRGFSIAQARYKSGLSTLLELNDAELSQRQAQLNLSQACYNYLIAKYQIEAILGK